MKLRRETLILVPLFFAGYLSFKTAGNPAANREQQGTVSGVSRSAQREEASTGDHFVPAKSKNRPRRFTVDELVDIALAAKEDEELEEARALFNAALKRDPDNEEIAKQLAILENALYFENFPAYGSPIDSVAANELGMPVQITITESRIEQPVFSSRPMVDK